jgi:hypothetical protein
LYLYFLQASNQQHQIFNEGGKTVVILGAALLEQAGILLDMVYEWME